ncbi:MULTISPECIES: twin-arginine translocase subunit TatC [unclassified Spirosoma]|uniref:twin-arginine translocase subunit TatC n=1 Tax=unclassified Spirosoma TaxID=2621999 RepID=UPI0025F8A922|nr:MULTISPECIES: twin-arginine translocase subunit TatC [unclassified Spirosoma]
MNFLANFEVAPGLKNQFDSTSYLSVLATLSSGCALIFQMPIVVFVLSKVVQPLYAGVQASRLDHYTGHCRSYCHVSRNLQLNPGGAAFVGLI